MRPRETLAEALEAHLSERELSTLTNALTTAMADYLEHEAEMVKAKAAYEAMTEAERAQHDQGMVHGRVYAMLAEQMATQRAAVRALLDRIEGDEEAEG